MRLPWVGLAAEERAEGKGGALRQDRPAHGRAGFFVQEVRTMSTPDLRAMLDRDHPMLSVRRQCALLSLARSGVYRPVLTEDETDLALMRRIDELFLAHPFLGSRRMAK